MKQIQQVTKRTLKVKAGETAKLRELIQNLFTIKNTQFALTIMELLKEADAQISKEHEKAQLMTSEFYATHEDKMNEFENKRIEILEANALKNEAGEFLFKEGTDGQRYYDFDKAGQEAYTKAYSDLTKEYEEVLVLLQEVTLKAANTVFELEIFLNDLDFYLNNITDLSAKEIESLMELFAFIK